MHWVNKPEARELFEFLNPYLKLSDYHLLSGEILNDAVSEGKEAMQVALKENQTGVTLTFESFRN